jgi:RNA polymerase sigma-54 factor
MNENPTLKAGKRKMSTKDEFENEDYDDYDDAESDKC